MFRKLGLIVALLLIGIGIHAQTTTSPLTSRGIGEIEGIRLPSVFSMGGAGISNGDIRFLNIANPALLVDNSVYTFTAGLSGGTARLSDDVNTERTGNGNLSHLAMSFPVINRKWTSAIMFKPYSTVSHKYQNTTVVPGTTTEAVENVRGTGGLNQLLWANGIAINSNLSVGANLSFLFGNIISETSNQLSDTTGSVITAYAPTIQEKETLSDFALGAGARYSYPLKDKLKLNFGLTYDLQTKLNGKQLTTLESRLSSEFPLHVDTLAFDTDVKMTLPSTFGFGVSLVNSLKWTAALDMKMTNWSNFADFDGSNDGMDQSIIVALGGKFTPDAGDINKYLNRVSYRLGLSYEDTPYQVNGNSVQDFGINFGFSLPVSSISSLDAGFKFGTRGNISKIGLKEDYFKFQVALTFNDRLWFIKRKFD